MLDRARLDALTQKAKGIKMAEGGNVPELGGYDYEFTSRVPEDWECLVCHLTLKDPVQIVGCGHRLCNICMECLLRRHSPTCPADRKPLSREKIFPDAACHRKILDLTVKCSHPGCSWTGELRAVEEHQSKCLFKVLKCERSNSGSNFTKQDLNAQMAIDCSRRKDVEQKQQIKKELQQLEVAFNGVKETAMKIQQTFQECKFKSLLSPSPSVSEILNKTDKVLKVSQNCLDNVRRENGRPSEMNVKIMQDCSAQICRLLQKAEILVHEANSKAAKEEAKAKEEEEEEEKRQQASKTNWKPTNEALTSCSMPSLLSSNLSTVSLSSHSVSGNKSYISSSDVASASAEAVSTRERLSIKMAASAEVLIPERLSSVSPNGSPMELANFLKGLASCSKGRLTYDADWKPTKEALAACSKPPLLSPSDLEDQTSRSEKNAELHEKELQASFDDTHAAIHHYEIERRHEAGERLNSRKEKFVENSKKLVEEKNHYLQQKENERVDEFIRSVQALQQDEKRKSEEARLRQQKLEQSHQEYKERAVRKVKEVEELRLQVLKQEQQIKKELQQLEVSPI